MLKGLLRSQEDKLKEKVEECMSEGLKALGEKFYNKAMIEFDKAMDLDRNNVYPRIKAELDAAASSGQLDAALSLGMNLIKDNNQDFELANKLGNYARELGNFKQAEGLYKMALKVNKNFPQAFYNLAATMARVDKYDDAAMSSITVFDGIEDFIYPDFVGGGTGFIENLCQNLADSLGASRASRLNELKILKEQKDQAGHSVEASELQFEIRKINDMPKGVQPEDVIAEFQKRADVDAGHKKDHLYNMGIYALQNRKLEVADQCFGQLSVSDFEYLEVLKAILTFKKGDQDAAIKHLENLLGENEFNRIYNVNLGLFYRFQGKKFLAAKYLIKTASLLEKSGGIYSMKELVRQAHAAYDEGQFKKALNFYQIASTEIPDARLWERLGTLYAQMKKYDDAVAAFRKLQEMEPDSETGFLKLKEIHDYYFAMGKQLLDDRKFKPASDYFRKALGVLRLPETVKTAAIVYGQLKQSDLEEELLDEYQKLMQIEKEKGQEVERQNIIREAKTFMAQKNYLKAASSLESALRMKVDKNVFLQLAGIYKGLKKTEELHALVGRWEKMVEHEEKMKQYEKDKERQQKE